MGLGYVKVIESIRSTTKNPNDRSDSKMGPTSFTNNLRKQSDDRSATVSQY